MDAINIEGQEAKEVEDDTYTITFCDPARMETKQQTMIQQENIINAHSALFMKELGPQDIGKLAQQIILSKKSIVKIEIIGHANNQDSVMHCGPLYKELLAYLLNIFPFDKKILLIKNMTCYSNRILPSKGQKKQEELASLLGEERKDLYDVVNTTNDIFNMCDYIVKNNVAKYFYYGGNDSEDALREDVTYIERHGGDNEPTIMWDVFKRVDPDVYKINQQEYYRLQKEAEEEATQNKQNYIKQLYSDLQNFKNSQQTLQNNVLYQMNNNQFNNPTYSTGMDNNVFGNNPYQIQLSNNFPPQQPQFVSPPQQYQQNTYGMQLNNNINNNTTNTNNGNVINNAMMQGDDNNISSQGNLTGKNNETVFCNLTKGFCLGRKCW